MRQHTVRTPYQVGEAHFYSTEIDGKLVLFDTGPSTPEAFAFLREQVDLARLKYLFITHCHDDHFGLATSIARESDARIYIPRKDSIKLRNREKRLPQLEKVFAGCGFDAAVIRKLMDWFRANARRFAGSEHFGIVEESDALERLRITCSSFAGHSQSDLVYFCDGHAITGDILLRNVFQVPLLDIDVEDFTGRFVNYVPWCSSLAAMSKLRGYKLCPGHCGNLDRLDETLTSYLRRLLRRAERVRKMEGVESVQEMIVRLFGKVPDDPVYLFSKASEMVFLRDFLSEPVRLKHSLEQIGLFESVSDLYAAAAG